MTKVEVRANWVQNVQSIANNTRGHSVVVDLPKEKGGNNTGPTALELALISLAECAVTIFADVCKKSNVTIDQMEVVAEANRESNSSKISDVKIKTTVKAKERKQKLDAIWRRTEATCPVISIFQDNTPIKVEFQIINE
ncbi:MAG: OsmC family protein [Candidatus Bathyarchaeum tardum]|nr:MAG: OsmC family protein [Candidatus Bathyarchaeum tardum]